MTGPLMPGRDAEKPRALFGACLCRGIAYAVTGAFRYAMNCHCSNCRRATGAAFKPFAGIERTALTIVRGAGNIVRYGDGDAHDAHCATCGSLLYSVVRNGAYVHVTMGTLLGEPGIRPSMHICVGSKAGWYEISDDLPQFDGLPD